MKRDRTIRRRATVLIMVVTLLALLFVIVSGYLTLARFDRQTLIIAQQGNIAEEVVDGVNKLVLSLVREQWLDSQGELLTGKPTTTPPNYEYSSYEDIGGCRKSHWQAALDPMFDPTAVAISPMPYGELEQVRWPGVSSFEPVDRPIQSSVRALMLKQLVSADATFYQTDVERNARLGFMDADGDGVPDAGLMASAVATELANTLGGTSVRLRGTGIDPSAIPPDYPNSPANEYRDDFWRRYDSLARYEVAVRVVPHGGMVSLAVPNATAAQQWNEEFAWWMFSWLGQRKGGVGTQDDALMERLHAQAAAVEPALRRRGGLLPSYRLQGEDARVPDLLRELEDSYPAIFAPTVNGEVPWQRFNLATIDPSVNGNEWELWQDRAFLNATLLKQDPTNLSLLANYNCRHLTTTISYSDDLCRKQERDPNPNGSGAAGLGVYHGQTKFYLGDIAQAFDPLTGAFLGDGGPGTRIVHRLAGYFHDMLSAYKDWPNWPDRPGWTELTDDQKRFRQAYMLAVNTVAFAAPRDPSTGFIDVVAVGASFEPLSTRGTTYVGYAPQPFITQVIAYDSEGDPNETPEKKIALGVELYNPNDPTGAVDDQGLYLPQFALSVNDQYPTDPGALLILDGPHGVDIERMPGRSFVAFSIRAPGASNNTYFTGGTIPNNYHGDLQTPLPINVSANSIYLRLWRGSALGEWYLVDEVELDASFGGTGPPDDHEWFVDGRRDTRDEAYFGDCGLLLSARWRMAVNFPPSAYNQEVDQTDTAPDATRLGIPGPQPTGTACGPTLPLYTMNANLFDAVGEPLRCNIHGADRPPSFPTVGFMLFVPRFSHTREMETTIPPTVLRRPISVMLEAVWKDKGYSVATCPADFGHMPIFDNTQNDSGDYFADDEAGRIPWGLLVFDYFTTLNPDGLDGVPNTVDDLDPYRVPGRININAAPWYVLAGLPIAGPANDVDGDGSVDLPLHASASPAFWSTQSGILAGLGANTVPRSLFYHTSYPDVWLTRTNDGWWRLGVDLALSVAEYRDRIPYLPLWDAATVYKGSFKRNPAEAGVLPPIRYRDRQRYGEIRQGGTADPDEDGPTKYGFLSLGELANVKGFDSLTYAQADGYTQPVLEPLAAPGSGNSVAGDFMRAVSLLALLDTHFLTTRSNTFTAYVTVRDRQDAQQSVRSQITVDRSNILPRLVLDANGDPLLEDADGDGFVDDAVVIENDELPEVIAERRVGYNNARFDD